jgi:hypothetical protein
MSDDGTSYTLKIDEQIDGLEKSIDKLEAAEMVASKADLSMGKLGTGMKHVGDASEKAGSGHAKHSKDAEHLGGVLDRLVKAGMDPFLHRAKEIAEFEFIRRGVDKLIDAPGEITEKLKELGGEMLMTAAKAERMDLSFKLTLGQEGAEEVLGYIEKIRGKTEFTGDQLKGWSSELLRAGVKAKDLDTFLAAGGDVAAKSTDRVAGMGAAIEALTKAQLTGKVDMRVLKGLSIGNEELKTLPQFKGMNDKQLNKAKEEGSISKNDLLTVIAGKDGVLGDLALQAGKTFDAHLKNVKEIPEEIYKGLYKTAGFEKLGDFLGGIYDSFGSETETGKAASEALASALDFVATKLQGIDLDVVAEKVTEAFDAMPIALETVRDLFTQTGDALGVFGGALDGLTKIIDFIQHPFTSAAEKTQEDNKDFTKNRDPVDIRYEQEQKQKLIEARQTRSEGKIYIDPDIGGYGPQEDGVTRARKRKDEIRREQRESGKSAGDGLKEGASGSNPKLTEAGAGMGEALKQGTNDSLDIHSPSRALFRSGAFAGDGFVEGIESRNDDIEDAMNTAFSAPAAGSGIAGALGSSPISVSVDLSGMSLLTPAGADVDEMSEVIADKIRSLLPGALISAFDGARAQAGS